jgi:hypothetical protein
MWLQKTKTALELCSVAFLIGIVIYSFIVNFIGASIAFFISVLVWGVLASGGQTRHSRMGYYWTEPQGMPIFGAIVGAICFLILANWVIPGISFWFFLVGVGSIAVIGLGIIFK